MINKMTFALQTDMFVLLIYLQYTHVTYGNSSKYGKISTHMFECSKYMSAVIICPIYI